MISLGEAVIIGGGCYGSFYAGQLLAARAKGAATWRALRVIDRNPACQAASLLAGASDAAVEVAEWAPFLDGWLGVERAYDDQIVPSPLMPHLMASWIEAEARRRWPDREVGMTPAETPVGTPFDRLHPGDGVRYVSWADWLCPVHCIEPATCPAIGAPRSWEMGETVTEWTADRARSTPTAGPVLFTCRHMVHGVGMYPARTATEGLAALTDALERTPSGVDLVIASLSACHGAVGVLRVGPAGNRASPETFYIRRTPAA